MDGRHEAAATLLAVDIASTLAESESAGSS